MNREKITTGSLKELHGRLLTGEVTRVAVAEAAVEAMADAVSANAFVEWNSESLLRNAQGWDSKSFQAPDQSFGGLPVSVKDIFDVAGVTTTCASRFYSRTQAIPGQDAGYVSRWRRAGALLSGKTNLNEFAYGITGENIHFGDCTIPGHPQLLTGGSSSGAAASVVAGASCLALGTDTGGSLRVPAALCGLVSFRQSLGFGELDGLFPLAHSFDTVGWLQRHLGDVAWAARRLHPERPPETRSVPPRIVALVGDWLSETTPEVIRAMDDQILLLEDAGATVARVDPDGFQAALELFVPIQAYEAYSIHAPYWAAHQSEYDPVVRSRLEFGSQIGFDTYQSFQLKRWEWVEQSFAPLWRQGEFLLAPASALTTLRVGVDHSQTRPRLLRLTTPASLAGLPVLTTPALREPTIGVGFQWMARRGEDPALWALADWLSQVAF